MIKPSLGLAAAMAVALLASAPALAIDPLPADAAAVPDPAVRTGTLSNGLRYAIMRNATPARAVSIRLAVRAGGYDEADSEEGYAHFIEHMAFRSTRQAPEGSLDTRFARLGIAFGRDENAATGLESTLYQMDVPAGDEAAIGEVLEWLRGAADGIVFAPAAVEREKGVLLAELRARTSPSTIMTRELARFQAPGLRSINREVGGTEASLRDATPAALQAFYDRWYRPENATLVIVGDGDPEKLLALAEKTFGTWRTRGAPGRRPVPAALPERGLEAFTRNDPSLPLTGTACRFAPLDGPRDASLQRLRRETLSHVWVSILTERLKRTATKSGSPLFGAGPVVNRELPDARVACLIALPNQGKWREGLAEAQAELRRFAAGGPTAVEVETATETLRSRLRAAVYQSGTRSTRDLAQAIAEAALEGRPYVHPRESMRIFDLAVAGLTPADVKRAFEGDWAGGGPLLSLTGPVEMSREDLAAAWRTNESATPLASFADDEKAEWAYWKFGKRGKVGSRKVGSDFTRLVFENGVALNFKQTAFQSNGVEIRVRFGHGERGLAATDRMPMALAAGLFPNGGLGKMDFAQIGSALANSTWSFTLEPTPTAFFLSSSTLTDNVEQQMRLLAAYMTDPGFRPSIDEKLPTVIDFTYRMADTEPAAVATMATERALFPGRESMPPREKMAAYRAADFERMLKPVLTRAPVEVTIVGDVDEATALTAVATTFGALPPRSALPPPSGDGPFRHFPARIPPPVTERHRGPADKAAALLVWPLYVASPQRRREEYALMMLSSIMGSRLLRQVRVEMGKTYSPVVGMNSPDAADQGTLNVVLEGSPRDIDALVDAAMAVAGGLARDGVTQRELDDARTPVLASADQALLENGAWAMAIAYSTAEPEAMRELAGLRSDLEALTVDDVRRAAATWLASRPMISRALPAPR